jgi:hypothetical protein
VAMGCAASVAGLEEERRSEMREKWEPGAVVGPGAVAPVHAPRQRRSTSPPRWLAPPHCMHCRGKGAPPRATAHGTGEKGHPVRIKFERVFLERISLKMVKIKKYQWIELS